MVSPGMKRRPHWEFFSKNWLKTTAHADVCGDANLDLPSARDTEKLIGGY